MRRMVFVLIASLIAACGSSPERPVERPRVEAKAEKRHAAKRKKKKRRSAEMREAKTKFPKKCKRKRKRCMPPSSWVARLCNDVYPDLALHMFRPKTPWKRLYMLQNAEAFNASGGASLIGDKMRAGEEVIALRRRRSKQGIEMSDTSGYDVLRWNGACATVHDGEVTSVPPDQVLHAKIEWRDLSLKVRQTLELLPEVQEAYEARRKHCRSRVVGEITAECQAHDEELTAEVVRWVRSGAKLPEPEKVP